MKESEESWEVIRARGRNRFLIRSIFRVAWICGLASVVIEWGLMLFGHNIVISEIVARWAFFSVALGASFGFTQWRDNEERFQKDVRDESQR